MWLRSGVLVLVLGFVGGCERPALQRLPADLILTNAAVYTLDPTRPWAEAVAIGAGRILAVGTAAEVSAGYTGAVQDLHGQMVLPGFHDAHTHPVIDGLQLLGCDLSGIAELGALLSRVRACADATAGEQWLVGGGWDRTLFADGNASGTLLDELGIERPIALRSSDGHSLWVNAAALAQAGITAATPDPVNGRIERFADGAPSGTLHETARMLVEDLLPPVVHEQRVRGALAVLALAAEAGITAMIDAAVGPAELAVWRELERDGRLTVRVVASIALDRGIVPDPDPQLIDPGSRGSAALVRTDAAKIWLDGVLEGETAALLQPYLGGAGRAGNLLWTTPDLTAALIDLDARGVQVHLHAIGDAAVRQGLDAIAAARLSNGPRDNRHHIAHLQLVHPDDYGRFGELGVGANFQALWAWPDAYITGLNLPAVGQDRVDRMYPIASIERAGGLIVGGSDWAVSSLNPLQAIEVALTRQDPAATDASGGVLNAAEAVSLHTMLAAYTSHGAYLMHQEDRVGTIAAGKAADLVVLEQNLFELDPHAIGEVAVTMTLFQGRPVYRRGG